MTKNVFLQVLGPKSPNSVQKQAFSEGFLETFFGVVGYPNEQFKRKTSVFQCSSRFFQVLPEFRRLTGWQIAEEAWRSSCGVNPHGHQRVTKAEVCPLSRRYVIIE